MLELVLIERGCETYYYLTITQIIVVKERKFCRNKTRYLNLALLGQLHNMGWTVTRETCGVLSKLLC